MNFNSPPQKDSKPQEPRYDEKLRQWMMDELASERLQRDPEEREWVFKQFERISDLGLRLSIWAQNLSARNADMNSAQAGLNALEEMRMNLIRKIENLTEKSELLRDKSMYAQPEELTVGDFYREVNRHVTNDRNHLNPDDLGKLYRLLMLDGKILRGVLDDIEHHTINSAQDLQHDLFGISGLESQARTKNVDGVGSIARAVAGISGSIKLGREIKVKELRIRIKAAAAGKELIKGDTNDIRNLMNTYFGFGGEKFDIKPVA